MSVLFARFCAKTAALVTTLMAGILATASSAGLGLIAPRISTIAYPTIVRTALHVKTELVTTRASVHPVKSVSIASMMISASTVRVNQAQFVRLTQSTGPTLARVNLVSLESIVRRI